MKSTVSFEDRIKGCLIGAAIGGELGLARWVHPEWFDAKSPADLDKVRLEPPHKRAEPHGRFQRFDPVQLIDLGVQAYLDKGGRVTPEDFGPLFAASKAVAYPSFSLDNLHTIQEILKEGMNPRISGMGVAPCGVVCAFMPAVGAFHFADPQRAYLEGVELASVAQPRLGADWAGLCAAAVAAAFEGGADLAGVIDRVLKIAHQNNKDLFYEIDPLVRQAAKMKDADPEVQFKWWMHHACKAEHPQAQGWIAPNPPLYALTMLRLKGEGSARAFFSWLLSASPEGFWQWMGGGHTLPAVIGGAVLGALRGPAAFDEKLLTWGEPLARPWMGMVKLLQSQVRREGEIVSVIERAAKMRSGGPDGATGSPQTVLRDKIYGNILAGAIGNAMGSPVEGAFFWQIDQQYPGGIQTVLNPKCLETEDDNQMAMLLTETYIARGGAPVMARHFGDTWTDRLNRDHFFPLCMGNAYDLIRQGWDPRIAGHWAVVTGSTVMCMEPVGIFNIGDPQNAFIDAMAVSYMYQRGLDVLAAASVAATVAAALRPDATVDSVCQAAIDTAPDRPLKTFDRRKFKTFRQYVQKCLDIADNYDDVLAARKELYDKCLFYHHIDPLELWGFALAMFKISDGDVRQAAIGGTNIGRDSDTIAGRAAMLAGTLRGAKNVPPDWIKMFQPDVLVKIRNNANRFADVILGGKVQALKDRQQAAGAHS